jgi:hypothetical protein
MRDSKIFAHSVLPNGSNFTTVILLVKVAREMPVVPNTIRFPAESNWSQNAVWL